jgi:hypothetical protein
MKSLNRSAQVGCIASYLLLVSACNSPDTSVTAIQNPDPGIGMETLYSETFSDSGRFTITKDPSGGVNYNVQARIGSEAEKLLASSSTQPTLVEAYRILHGGLGDVPAIVAEVSTQLIIQTPNSSLNNQPTMTPKGLEKEASLDAFSSGYCKDIRENSYLWKWEGCFWMPSVNYLTTIWMDPGDRVYAWNSSPYTATMSIWNQAGGQPNTWRPTLQPYWVTWFQWGGNYSNALVSMNLPAGKKGELGLVVHYPVPIVR